MRLPSSPADAFPPPGGTASIAVAVVFAGAERSPLQPLPERQRSKPIAPGNLIPITAVLRRFHEWTLPGRGLSSKESRLLMRHLKVSPRGGTRDRRANASAAEIGSCPVITCGGTHG